MSRPLINIGFRVVRFDLRLYDYLSVGLVACIAMTTKIYAESQQNKLKEITLKYPVYRISQGEVIIETE